MIISRGSTSDPVVRPLIQRLNALTKSITSPSFKTMNLTNMNSPN